MNDFSSSTSSQTTSWFEFLLNPNLLDTFLTAENLENAGTDLIIQFLISANLIEQKSKQKGSNENPNDVELKENRIRALRHLAMKIAAKLHWDLVRIERRIPVAVASDLIHCFFRLTNQNDRSHRDRELFQQLKKLEEPALFALQLLHRWTVRTCVQSSFPMKPVKIFQVNVPGYVNPLQHMREPNENVIQMARSKVRESVQALENLIEWIDDISLPVDQCFSLIDIERGIVTCDWQEKQIYPAVECRARIQYDLGMIYFHEQNYQNALSMFRRVQEVRDQLAPSNYFSSLDGYLNCLQSINPSVDQNHFSRLKQRFQLGCPVPTFSIEDYISLLAEDNLNREMSLTARQRLEDRLDAGSQLHKIVSSFNLIRFLLDGKQVANPQHSFDYLETALQRLTNLTEKQQKLLNSFLRIHFEKLSKKVQEQLKSDRLTHLVGEKFVVSARTKRTATSKQRSYLFERSKIPFKKQTQLVHSSEPETIAQAVQEMEKTSEHRSTLIDLFPMSVCLTPIDQSLSSMINTNALLGHTLRILNERAKRAKSLENFAQARLFLTRAIQILNSFQHPDILFRQLYIFFEQELLLCELNEVLSRQRFLDHDNHLWEKCQKFLAENHSDEDVNLELFCMALAYAISREKTAFLQSLMSTNRRVRPYLDIARLFARLLNNENLGQISRELWEKFSELFSEKSSMSMQQNKQMRSRFTPLNNCNEIFLFHLTNPLLIQVSYSLLSRLYALVHSDQCHVEIYSEFGRYWPTSIDYRQRMIRSSTIVQLIEHLFKHVQRIEYLPNQIRASLYRMQADIYLGSQQYSSAMQNYLISICIDTNHLSSTQTSPQDDLSVRNMIKASLQLGFHAQVACLCQLLSTPDYNTIFKSLQENYINDDIDDYSDCIWDFALLEAFIHNANQRGYEDKKRFAIRICKQKDLNGNNAEEVRSRMIRIRKRLLYKQLIGHYLLPSSRLYRLRTINKLCHQTNIFQ